MLWARIVRNRASKLCFAFVSTSETMAFFWPRCGVSISTLRPRFSDKNSSSSSRSSNADRNMNLPRYVRLIEIHLLHQRFDQLGRLEFDLVLPEELAPVHDVAVAHVEQIHRHQRRLGVDAKMSASSPSAAAIFCFCSISSTVEIRSRRFAASSNRIVFRSAASI